MSEEQFWRSNPRIIAVWANAWKKEQNYSNDLMHKMVGTYVLSALTTAIDGVLNGKKAKAKYTQKPIQLFELTEEEKKKEQQKAIAQFIAWAGAAQIKYKGKEDNNGADNRQDTSRN